METYDIRNENELHGRIITLTQQTLLSLLRTYDYDSKLFDSSVQTRGSTKGTQRDTALVLMALERAVEGMSRDKPWGKPVKGGEKKARKDFKQDLEKKLGKFKEGKPEPISYNAYRAIVFEPTLNKIARGKPRKILGSKTRAGRTPVPFVDREAFTCSCILSLLNMYPCEETHGHVYMDALDMVLEELVRLYPPHYVFGSASLTGTEPHAFVAYVCLRCLKELGETVQHRANEHEKVSALLGHINDWLEKSGPIFKKYKDPEWFVNFVKAEAEQLKNPVGLSAVIGSLKNKVLPGLKKNEQKPRKKQAAEIANQIRKAFGSRKAKGTVIRWSEDFAELVCQKLKELDAQIEEGDEQLQEEWVQINAAKKVSRRPPGTNSIELAKMQMKNAGPLWRRAVFQSMIYDLETPRNIYEKLDANPTLLEITDAIRKAGKRWTISAQRTREYLALFAKWAHQELNRQITLYNLSGKTNFDPVQLAFALRIYHDIEVGANKDLIAQGLEIVMEAQHEDGTWPTGAPFVVEPTLAAVHVANIEIINALMPLIDKDDSAVKKEAGDKGETTVERYYLYAHRVFNWLEKNHHGASSDKRKDIAGWSTDRLLETERVDMWATAAGLQFLVAYGRLRQHLLKLKMAETFDFSRPVLKWSSIVDAELELDYKDRTTSKIYENYIQPFKETGRSDYSAMVLHGPPGTAKSTLAQAIAAELNWSLVTITPSDFVKEGIEQSENKARKLFKELLLLRETVVLFDELDEMLRDRQDQESQTGIGMLRFLIPGMLPKLQMLKQFGEKNRLIFIIATNYKDRLDSAVIRTGRVDDAFAVVPPDQPSRYCLIWNFLQNANCKDSYKKLLTPLLAAKTQGWVYKEIEHLVGLVRKEIPEESILPRQDDEDKEEKSKKLLELSDLSPKDPPNATLKAYRSYSILGQQAALDPLEFYRGRYKASKEILSVLGAYGVTTRSRNIKQRQRLVDWVTGIPSEHQGRLTPGQAVPW
ncbi:MAG TPA: AAA family ATPase [Candidatus Angelobacter sp.]